MVDDKLPRVVRVINEFTVVLNRGEREDVLKGDKYLVFGLGEEVFDPDTDENLGPIELVRGIVMVTHVQEKMSTARTATSIKIPGRKRRIERNQMPLVFGKGIEEIEEDHSYEDEPLKGVQPLDFARPI